MKETTYQINIPASVALLGDLHGRPYQPVIDSLRKNKPQIIAIAGDIVSGYHPADGVSPLVSQKNMHDYEVIWSRESIYDVADIADYIKGAMKKRIEES